MQQEHEKTGNTRALVDHNPEARFVVNTHSIHNYKLVAAVVPQDLLVPFTSVNGDIIALRKKAAGLVQGEKQGDDDDAAQPTDNSDPLPFDRGGTKGLATAGPNTIFKGTLSTQSKLELMKMASVLGIPVSEKDRKQELALKVREYLEANPDRRNNTQFTQLTWRSNRKATTIITPAPPETTSMSLLLPHFLLLSSRLPAGGQMASGSYLAPSAPSLYPQHTPLLNYLMTPWYQLSSPQINGLHAPPGYVIPNQPLSHAPLPPTPAPNHDPVVVPHNS